MIRVSVNDVVVIMDPIQFNMAITVLFSSRLA